jgi:hypothetical protein
MEDLAQGQSEVHHRKVVQALKLLPEVDVVMLAQFSMSGALSQAQTAATCPVLSSPDCAALMMKRLMMNEFLQKQAS